MDKQKEIINRTEKYVYEELKNEYSGHDWWHIHRVVKIAKNIAKEENANVFICELAALLHDIADEKINKSKEAGIEKVSNWLKNLELAEDEYNEIIAIITSISFKGGGQPAVQSLEGKIVQDADRLDAIGAVGIARCFAFAGAKGQLIHDPDVQPRIEMTREEYQKRNTTAVNHFYEKLFKLKDLMNTDHGKIIAKDRHQVMEQYVEQLLLEWNGKR